jgi:hypothetical protein
MAKKRKKSKKSAENTACAAPMSSPDRSANAGIEEAENGFIVRVSSEGLGKGKKHQYTSKKFVATDHPTALRIASQGFAGLAKKVSGKGKKGGKKKVSVKKM